YELVERVYKACWIFDGRLAMERQARRSRGGGGLDVQVVQHLDVVAHEPDGHDDDVTSSRRPEVLERVVDVGLEPRIPRAAAPALVRQAPRAVMDTLCHGRRRRVEVVDV